MTIGLEFLSVALLVFALAYTLAVLYRGTERKVALYVKAGLRLSLVCTLMWAVSYLVPDGYVKYALRELRLFLPAMLPAYSLSAFFEYTGGHENALAYRNRALVALIPLLTLISGIVDSILDSVRANIPLMGAFASQFYWLCYIYGLVLYCVGLGDVYKHFFSRPRLYRGRMALLLAFCTAMILACAGDLLGAYPTYGDVSVASCAVFCLIQYVSLVRTGGKRRLIQKIRSRVVDELDSVVMIFDGADRLVDVNRPAFGFLEALVSLEEETPGRGIDGREMYHKRDKSWYSIGEKKLFDDKQRYAGRVVVFNDITELKNTADELLYIATHDYLTGLNNRLAFRAELKKLSAADLPASLICMNISGMKLINAVFGNEYGDRIIVRLARELERLVTDGFCARMNGDEFGIILRGADEAKAEVVIESIKSAMAEGGTLAPVGVEVSCAVMNHTREDAGRLYSESTASMRNASGNQPRQISAGFLDYLEDTLRQLRDKSGRRTRSIRELVRQAADELKLTAEEKERLLLLSATADVGLIAVSPEIVGNIGNLTNEQWEEMKLHTVRGHNIALSLGALSPIAEDILHHHERYDGYGYPKGLKGEEIPLLSRIFAAAEFYADAPPETAAERLRARSGTQFDPEVVGAILKTV